jgi:hypothetical protein
LDGGFYAVDHSGRNDPGAIEFREAVLFELPQSVVGMTFKLEGPVFGATYHIYDADGVRISGGNVEDLMSDDGMVTVSSQRAIPLCRLPGRQQRHGKQRGGQRLCGETRRVDRR